LIYAAIAAYLVAAVALARGRRRVGNAFFFGGFVIATMAFARRWIVVGHVPLQNLFEVFLCLGMLVFPLAYFCHRYLRVESSGADSIIGIVTLFPAGFVFSAEPQQLPPALQSDLFLPHVASYMISYMLMAKAAIEATKQLIHRKRGNDARAADHERATYTMVRLGFPLLTIGLVLGAVWGKIAWGDYWNWDPKELWSLASWLLFVGYFHFRQQFGRRFPRANSALALSGMAAIVCTLLWVNLGRIFSGLHSYAT
jgi:ABC-type transport system involved in cytochrome c biogenesis permease subunit